MTTTPTTTATVTAAVRVARGIPGWVRARRGAARVAGVLGSPVPGGATCLFVLVAAGLVADRYTAATLSRILVIGLLAASVALLAGWCGLSSLGQTAPFAVGAYTTGLLAKHHHQLPALVLLLAAAGAGALFAAATGLVVLRTRGTLFLMVTLAVGELVVITAGRWRGLTGGTDGLLAIPATRAWPRAAPLVDPRHTYWYVLSVTALLVAATVAVLRSPAGMLLAATRDNEPRLRAAGHPSHTYLLVAYTGAGVLAAVGGSLLVSVQRYISPADVGFDLAALVLLAVVIGGTRSLLGAFAGAGIIVAARDWLAGPWPGHAPLVVGLLLLGTVYLLPTGLSGLASRLRSIVQTTTTGGGGRDDD